MWLLQMVQENVSATEYSSVLSIKVSLSLSFGSLFSCSFQQTKEIDKLQG